MSRPGQLANLLRQLHTEYVEGLSSAQQDALRIYGHEGSGLNTQLRGFGIPADEEEEILRYLEEIAETAGTRRFGSEEEIASLLDQVILGAPRLDEPLSVFRRVVEDYPSTGDEAFLSTSLTPDAVREAGDVDTAELMKMLDIELEPDTPFLFIPEKYTSHPQELEVLLPRGQRLVPRSGHKKAIYEMFSDMLTDEEYDRWEEIVENFRLEKD